MTNLSTLYPDPVSNKTYDGTNYSATGVAPSEASVETALDERAIRAADRAGQLTASDNGRLMKASTSGDLSTAFTETLDTNNDGFADYNVRMLIPAASLSGTTGNKIKISLQAASGDSLSITGAYVGHAASSGDAYDFDGNQKQLLFSGSGTKEIAAGETAVSDEIEFDYDATENLIVSFGVENDAGKAALRELSTSNATAYYKTSASSDAGTTDVTGYTSIASRNFAVAKVEIREAISDLRLADIKEDEIKSSWFEISSDNYTATPSSTSTIAMSDTSDFTVGRALKYTDSRGTYYGIVTAITTDTSITIAGAPFDTGSDITALYSGVDGKVVQVDLFVAGAYADATGDLLANDMNTYFKWQGKTAHLVNMSAVQTGVDATSQPTVNIKINGSAVSSAGIQLSTAGTWVNNSAVAITTANYDINKDEAIEINCSTAGGSGDAENLTMSCVFIYE